MHHFLACGTVAPPLQCRSSGAVCPLWCLWNRLVQMGLTRVVLRGAILNRTYGTPKNLHISLFLPTIFGPIYYGPPQECEEYIWPVAAIYSAGVVGWLIHTRTMIERNHYCCTGINRTRVRPSRTLSVPPRMKHPHRTPLLVH